MDRRGDSSPGAAIHRAAEKGKPFPFLVISENRETFSDLERILVPKGYALYHSFKTENFRSLVKAWNIRIIVLCLAKAETEDFLSLREIKNFDALLEVILIGPPLPPDKTIEAIQLGAIDYLDEPFEEAAVLSTLSRIEKKIALRKETYQLEKRLTEKYVFEGMVSRNSTMLEIFSLIERLSKYSTAVLITGATGTGKEMVARAIHNLSPRRERKFVVCDCTAIPESLFESELFGYEKGAFTGAEKSKMGIIREADRETLFLDEIGEIPLMVQTKLLRVLEEHHFRPVGSNKFVEVDVRVICATNRDLRAMIKAGLFREDLYQRINMTEIRLPPLKERKEDIPLLCSNFLDRCNRNLKKNVRGISQRAKRILMNYDWPGNIRELDNLIERAVMLSHVPFIDIKDLPENLMNSPERTDTEEMPYPYLHLSLEDLEKKHILETLKSVRYNKQKTAQILGLTRPALYRKLRKHSLMGFTHSIKRNINGHSD